MQNPAAGQGALFDSRPVPGRLKKKLDRAVRNPLWNWKRDKKLQKRQALLIERLDAHIEKIAKLKEERQRLQIAEDE